MSCNGDLTTGPRFLEELAASRSSSTRSSSLEQTVRGQALLVQKSFLHFHRVLSLRGACAPLFDYLGCLCETDATSSSSVAFIASSSSEVVPLVSRCFSPEWTSRRLRRALSSCSLDEFDPGSLLVFVDVDNDVFFLFLFFCLFLCVFFFFLFVVVLRQIQRCFFPVVSSSKCVVKSLHVRVIRGSSQRDRYESILGESGDALGGGWRHDAPRARVDGGTHVREILKKKKKNEGGKMYLID